MVVVVVIVAGAGAEAEAMALSVNFVGVVIATGLVGALRSLLLFFFSALLLYKTWMPNYSNKNEEGVHDQTDVGQLKDLRKGYYHRLTDLQAIYSLPECRDNKTKRETFQSIRVLSRDLHRLGRTVESVQRFSCKTQNTP
ncbi:MAG: hypothetical protein EXX96DRAFT_584425 [Benjaminiella poitrasii]|nr:MAG: hypothetical protein EXX96DRAFT_584425 [Benjaminiella poitrasii]